ncbi:hypothetical protein C3Y98_02165 [Methylotenera oryzisoli]|uniref:Uncharacterized protein n=1 Tax=Methylotenera oryzisoli TaxID=2080758 RepID=A0A4Y9VU64_9PROT|nr:hypothetical protein C3Y98_02165 [Methylotenera oryzisoli]
MPIALKLTNIKKHSAYFYPIVYSSRHHIFNQNMVYYNHILATNNQLMVINNQQSMLSNVAFGDEK